MKRFCPKCGKEKKEFVKNFCIECFLQDHKVIKAKDPLELRHCKKCNRILLKGKWVEQEEKALKEFISSKIRVKEGTLKELIIELFPHENGLLSAVLHFSLEIDGTQVKSEKELLVKPAEVQCDTCSRLSGQYYEATLQVRFKGKGFLEKADSIRKETMVLLDIERKKDPLSAVTEMNGDRKGFDLRIGSNRAARKTAEALAKKFHSKVISSYSVEGVDRDGKEKRRFTYCVKI